MNLFIRRKNNMRRFWILFLLILGSLNSALAGDELPGLKIRQIGKGVYLHTSYQFVTGYGVVDSNGLVVVDQKDAYIIDTPWSQKDTEQLVAWLKERNINIKGSLSTHFHEDRTAGIAFLNSMAVPAYASKQTNELLRKSGRPQAKNTFENADFWLLKNKIEVYYPGGGHSPDNVVVWLPRQRILFGGCLVRAMETNSLGNVDDAVINAWPATMEKLESKFSKIKIVIPGHGNSGDAPLLEHTRKLAETASNKSM